MEFKKISAPSLKELFVEELENKILSGEIRVGEKLPSERELSNSMQVSRAVINAGIAELHQKGFIEVRPRVGNFVADYRRNGSLDTLVSIMNYNGGALASDEIRSILELRIVLIQLATKLAMQHATPEELLGLRDTLEELKASQTPDILVQNTFKLNHELGLISGNMLLPLLFTSFKELICPLWFRYVLNYGMNALIESNETFVNLILAGDMEAATQYVEDSTSLSIKGNRTLYSSDKF